MKWITGLVLLFILLFASSSFADYRVDIDIEPLWEMDCE